MRDIAIVVDALGGSPDGIVIGLGAQEFDAAKGTYGRSLALHVNLDSAIRGSGRIEANALSRYFRLRDRRKALRTEPLAVQLDALATFLRTTKGSVPIVWSGRRAALDHLAFTYATRAVGFATPWTPENERCGQTVFSLAGFDMMAAEGLRDSHDYDDIAWNVATGVIRSVSKLVAGIAAGSTPPPAPPAPTPGPYDDL